VIVVYQLGKAGSTSLWRALAAQSERLDQELAYVHFLGPKVVRGFEEAMSVGSGAGLDSEFVANIQGQIEHARALDERLRTAVRNGEGNRYLCGLRHPVDYAISVFVQTLHDAAPGRYGEIASAADPAASAASLFRRCLCWARQELPARRIGDAYESLLAWLLRLSREWLDLELLPRFEQTLDAVEFGRFPSILSAGPEKALLYRLEDFSVDLMASIADFTGLSSLTLAPENVSRAKPYGSLYAALVRRLRLSGEEFEWFAHSPFVVRCYPDRRPKRSEGPDQLLES